MTDLAKKMVATNPVWSANRAGVRADDPARAHAAWPASQHYPAFPPGYDPHLAWLVTTYLYTPEAAALLGNMPEGSQPDADISQPEGVHSDDIVEPDTASLVDQASDTVPSDTASSGLVTMRRVVIGASLFVTLVASVLLISMLFKKEADAVLPHDRLILRSYAIAVQCPFMRHKVTTRATGPNPAEVIAAAQRAFPNCTVDQQVREIESFRR